MSISNKGILKPIVFVIVFLLAIAIGGIVFWQYPEMQKENINNNEGTVKTEKDIETSVLGENKEETIDWKIYSNEEFGFEMKYHKSWYDYGKEVNPYGIITMLSTMSKELSEEETKEAYFGEEGFGEFIIYYRDAEDIKKEQEKYNTKDPLEAYLQDLADYLEKWEGRGWGPKVKKFVTEKIKIGGMDGVKIFYTTEEDQGDRGVRETTNIFYYFLDKNSNGAFDIWADFYGKDSEKYIEDFNQMLSTFKFLD